MQCAPDHYEFFSRFSVGGPMYQSVEIRPIDTPPYRPPSMAGVEKEDCWLTAGDEKMALAKKKAPVE